MSASPEGASAQFSLEDEREGVLVRMPRITRADSRCGSVTIAAHVDALARALLA